MRRRRHGMSIHRELAGIRPGERVRVCAIEGGWHVRQRLNKMGIHIGDQMFIKQAGPFHGPMLVETHGSLVAIGCGMARKVMVEPISEQG